MRKSDFKNFKCKVCGKCCKGEGFVKVTETEIQEIADFLNILKEEFINQYTRPGMPGDYWLTEKPGHDCIFLEENICKINNVKPMQCRNFPYSWVNDDTEETCPAMKELKEKINKE